MSKKMPWVIPGNCEGCGICVTKCKKRCLKMTKTNIDDVYVPWMYEPYDCNSCGQCAAACVMGAIGMTSYHEKAKDRFLTKKPMIEIKTEEYSYGQNKKYG